MPASGSRRATIHSENGNGTDFALDAYGFEIPTNAEVAAARSACEARQHQNATKWAKWAERRVLPPKDKLKKYCRRVSRFGVDNLLWQCPGRLYCLMRGGLPAVNMHN